MQQSLFNDIILKIHILSSMISPNQKIDNTVTSDKCSWISVCREENAQKQLLRNAQVCPILSEKNMDHFGIMSSYAPYEVFRANQSGTFLLACTAGQGEILINGQWKPITAGQACLFPPYMTNAFRANTKELWQFAWVRYLEKPNKKTVANVSYPRLGSYSSLILKTNILGVIEELKTPPPAKLMSAWINLIHQQVLKFSGAENIDQRLHKVFSEVIKNISHDWNLSTLANGANLSGEHLRRLCNDQLGRSPMQQVTFIRIAYAKELLMKSNQTVETIANKVGYKSAFSFSNTFVKWVGCRPSDFR